MTRLLSEIRKLFPFIILAFSLNLVLTTVALGHETTLISNPASSMTPSAVQNDSLVQAFILMSSNNASQLTQVQAYIKANGGRTVHIFPYQALIATVPASVIQPLSTFSGVVLVSTQALDLAAMDRYGPTARSFANAWNSLITPQPAALDLSLMVEAHSDDHHDAFIAPDLPPAGETVIAASGSVTPGYYQTSEYMAGSVAVGIVLVESDGSVDPSSENWTLDEKQLVFNEIMNGLNWWARLEPRANLSFVYDDHFSNPLPTRYEPITRSYSYQQLWIANAMSALGYNAPSYFTRVRDYNNALRSTYHTDWAFIIFVVDSSADTDNRFSDGYFAYAYLGGPFIVMTSENNGYGADNMDAVTAHEMGHIFHALDQYASASQTCTRRSGYLNIENLNSQYGSCLSNVTSIMRGQIYPYTARAIDPYAAGQVGWRDSDEDNILDPLDVEIPISIDNFLIDNNNNVTASGLAEIIPYPSPSHASVTINALIEIQYRFDQSAWQQALTSDGVFDETTEGYQLISPAPSPGLHTLDVAAFDSFGNISEPYASKIFIMPDPIAGGPKTKFYSPNHDLTSQSVTITGVAYHTQPNGTIAAVEYRINGGAWQYLQAQDGSFDTNYEPFTLNVNLSEGITYLIEAFATDAAGNRETQFASQVIQITSAQPTTLFLPLVVTER